MSSSSARVPTLRSQLIWLVCAVALPLLALAGWASWQAWTTSRERAAQALLGQTRAIAMRVDAEFLRAAELLHTLARLHALSGEQPARWSGELAATQRLRQDVRIDLAAWPQPQWRGRVLSGDDEQAAVHLSAMRSLPQPGAAEAELALPLAAGGTALRLRLSNAAFQRVLAEHRWPGQRVAAILDHNDTVFARARRPEALVGKPATAAVRQALAQREDGLIDALRNQDGVVSVVAYTRAPRSGYTVVASVPEDEFRGPLLRALAQTLAAGLAVLAVALALAYLLARRIMQALRAVSQAAEGVAPATGIRETDALAGQLAQAASERGQALRARERFLAMVSHELRTPLGVIMNWVRILQRPDIEPARVGKGLQVIEANAHTQALLVEDLIDFSRISSGKLQLRDDPVDLAALAQGVVDAAAPGAATRGVQLHLHSPQRLATLRGDPDRLRQVLWNLVGNAVKFVPPGGQVWLRLADEAGAVHAQVRDNGPGIPPALLDRLFDPFEQGEHAEAGTRSAGLGLGLAIARSIVQAHGGTISACNAPDGGAQFDLRIPIAPPAPASLPGAGA